LSIVNDPNHCQTNCSVPPVVEAATTAGFGATGTEYTYELAAEPTITAASILATATIAEPIVAEPTVAPTATVAFVEAPVMAAAALALAPSETACTC